VIFSSAAVSVVDNVVIAGIVAVVDNSSGVVDTCTAVVAADIVDID
jgi:hypothetical protein